MFKSKYLLYTIVFAMCIFAMCTIRYLASYNCFWGDDFEFSIYSVNEHTFDCLFGENRLEHGGYYIGGFLSRFMSFYLPLLFNIHPSDFIINLSFFKGLIFILVSFLAAKFAVFYKKSNFIFWGAFCLFLIYSVFFSVYADMITVNYAFFRYFFSLIFYCIFWYYIFKNLLYKYEKKNDALLWAVCLCGFIVGNSIEIEFFSSLMLVCLIIVYDVIICRNLKNKEDKDILKSFKLNLDKKFYYPFLYLFISIVMFTTTYGFIAVAKERGIGSTVVTFDLIKEFFTVFFKYYVIDLWYYWLLFILVCITAIIFAVKRKEIKKVILPVFMECSILTLMLSLLFCGKTHSINGISCVYLMHVNVVFLCKIILIIPLYMLISYVISSISHYSKSRKKKKIANAMFGVIFFLLTFVVISMFFVFPTPGYIQESQQKIYVRRQTFYVAEKMLRFYYLQNKVPEIPREVCIIHPYFIDYDFNNKDVLTGNKLSYVYYARLYKDENAKEIGYKYSDDALKKFYEEGGAFSKEELKNPKFSKLYNNDFVLSKQQDALSFDEMQKELAKSVEIFEI